MEKRRIYMKKKFLPLIAAALLTAALTACGGTESTAGGSKTDAGESKPVEASKETTAQTSGNEADLPNWRGVSDRAFIKIGNYNVGDEVKSGDITINIDFPSLKPTSTGRFAYQWDPALIKVDGCGYVEKEFDVSWSDEPVEMSVNVTLDKLEDAFEAHKDELISDIKYYRNMAYDDFDFKVENQELMTVNGFDVCKYSGIHTYTYEYTETNENGGLDRFSEDRECKFVIFAVDTDQLDGRISPLMIILIDESIEYQSKEPLPEGLLDIYGMKMVESIEIEKHWWEE